MPSFSKTTSISCLIFGFLVVVLVLQYVITKHRYGIDEAVELLNAVSMTIFLCQSRFHGMRLVCLLVRDFTCFRLPTVHCIQVVTHLTKLGVVTCSSSRHENHTI